MRASWFILAALLLSLLKTYGGEKIAGFATLPPGDTLEMRFTSEGCFHFHTYDLTFSKRVKLSVSISEVGLEWIGPGDQYRDRERCNLGSLNLSNSDLVGLDKLLTFYRTNTAGGCTTKNTIRITQTRNGQVIASEEFRDDSCGLRKLRGVLTIPALVQRLPNIARK